MKDLLRRLCERIAERLPVRDIEGADGSVFLSKYLLAGHAHGGWHLHLHCFHRSDEDSALHNHPWHCASFILAGGYREERVRGDGAIVTFERCPGRINLIGANTFHRVELIDGPCWTLFFNLPVVQDWGFLDRRTRAFVPWREFIARKGMVPNG